MWCSGNVLTLDREGDDRLEYSPPRQGETQEPLAILFGLAFGHALSRIGIPRLHAAAFKLSKASVLVLGAGYTGKSTLTAAAIRAKGRVVADDAVLAMTHQSRSISIVSSRSFVAFRKNTLALLPPHVTDMLTEMPSVPEDRWVLERQHASHVFAHSLRPQTIWKTTVDRRRAVSQITPMNQAETFGTLIQSASPLFLTADYPLDRDLQIPILTRLAETHPGFSIRLGRDLMEEPEATLSRLISETTV
jgi:hypothetical protein